MKRSVTFTFNVNDGENVYMEITHDPKPTPMEEDEFMELSEDERIGEFMAMTATKAVHEVMAETLGSPTHVEEV